MWFGTVYVDSEKRSDNYIFIISLIREMEGQAKIPDKWIFFFFFVNGIKFVSNLVFLKQGRI